MYLFIIIKGNKIGYDGILDITDNLIYITNLSELYIGRNPIGDKGKVLLEEIQKDFNKIKIFI